MSTLFPYLLMSAAISLLAKCGAITPFIAGGLAIAYGSINKVGYETLILSTLLFYLIAYFANTWAETNDRSMTTVISMSAGSKPLPLFILKALTLTVFVLLPIPKPTFYIQGLIAIVIAITLYCCSTEGNPLPAIIFQTILFSILGALFNRWSTHSSYTMALIAAVAIPNLIEGNEPSKSIYQNDCNVSIVRLVTAFTLTLFTPGLSSNAITKSLFLPGLSQSIAGSTIEAAIEGWALHIALNNQITTKAVLGDLLSLPELEWSTFTPYNSLKLVMLCLPLIAAAIVVCTPMLNLHLPVMTPIAILSIQATLTCGFAWTILYILCGCIVSWSPKLKDNSHVGLLFMTQM